MNFFGLIEMVDRNKKGSGEWRRETMDSDEIQEFQLLSFSLAKGMESEISRFGCKHEYK